MAQTVHHAVPVLVRDRPGRGVGANRKLTWASVRAMREWYQNADVLTMKEATTELARRYGVSPGTVYDVLKRQTWTSQ